MRLVAGLALGVAGLAALLALADGARPASLVALVVALGVAAAALRGVRRRDPHDFDVVVASVGGLVAAVFGGAALLGAWQGAPLAVGVAVAAAAAAATLAALVELALRGRGAGPAPDVLRASFPAQALVETDGVQWALVAPDRPASSARPAGLRVGLQNAWDGARGVVVRLELPPGFAAPEALRVALGPLETGVLHVPVAAVPGARAGRGRAWLEVRGSGGRRVRHRRYREIEAPASRATRVLGLLLALRNPFELLLALAQPAVRFELAPAPDVGVAPQAPPLRARWEAGGGPGAAPTRAAQAAAAFRRKPRARSW